MKGIDLNAAEMKRQVAAFYNADGNSALYSINVEQLIPEYMKMLSVIVDVIKAQDYTGTKFADMGCGNGTLDEMLLKNMHSIKVHCVDSSKGMLDIARRNLENYPGRVEFFQNDIGELTPHSLNPQYDCIISNLALHLLPVKEMKKFVNNNQFILSPKGYFILGAEIKIPGQSFVKLYSQRLENALAMNVPKDFAEKYLEIEKRSNIMTAQETIDLLKRERYVKPELVWANRNLAVFYAGRPEEQKWPVPTKKEMQELREKIRRRQANAGSNGF